MRAPTLLLAGALAFAALHARAAHAQQLELKRTPPPVAWAGCPAAPDALVTVSEDAAAQAERLAAAATEAAILGDAESALERLDSAAGFDPTSATVAYRRARVLESLDRRDEAIGEYCRYLTLPAADDAGDVRQRLAALTAPDSAAVPAAAADEFAAAIGEYDAARLLEAEAGFSRALALTPDWADAHFNRAAVRFALRRTQSAAADLRRYLELKPAADDFDAVLDLVASLRTRERYNTAATLAGGILVPGLGHFTTDRPVTGALVLGAAALAVTTGFLVERVQVDCLSVPENGACPPDQVLREDVERPWLVPSVAAAAAIGIGGAIEAWVSARRRNRQAATVSDDVEGNATRVRAPAVRPEGDRVHVELIRLRF